MRKINILLIITLSGLILLGGYWWARGSFIKIGVVRMEKLVYDYAGTKDATQSYSGQLTAWNTEMDAMSKDIQTLGARLSTDSITGRTATWRDNKNRLMFLRENYQARQQQLNERAAAEDRTMTGGIVQQLNEHIRAYAADKGYDLILIQAPDAPHIGYAGPKADITEQVLEYANQKYRYGK